MRLVHICKYFCVVCLFVWVFVVFCCFSRKGFLSNSPGCPETCFVDLAACICLSNGLKGMDHQRLPCFCQWCRFIFQGRVFIGGPSFPGTHSIEQGGFKLRDLSASASQVLRIKVGATTTCLFLCILYHYSYVQHTRHQDIQSSISDVL